MVNLFRFLFVLALASYLSACDDSPECGIHAKTSEAKFVIQYWDNRAQCFKALNDSYFPDEETAKKTLKVFKDGIGHNSEHGSLSINETGIVTIRKDLGRDFVFDLNQLRLVPVQEAK